MLARILQMMGDLGQFRGKFDQVWVMWATPARARQNYAMLVDLGRVRPMRMVNCSAITSCSPRPDSNYDAGDLSGRLLKNAEPILKQC